MIQKPFSIHMLSHALRHHKLHLTCSDIQWSSWSSCSPKRHQSSPPPKSQRVLSKRRSEKSPNLPHHYYPSFRLLTKCSSNKCNLFFPISLRTFSSSHTIPCHTMPKTIAPQRIHNRKRNQQWTSNSPQPKPSHPFHL